MDYRIRPYEKRDRGAVRDIAWQTALVGSPADAFFDDKEFLCDALTAYFTDCEPDSCFVAEGEGRVRGYLVGSLDTRRMHWVFAKKILPSLGVQFLRRTICLQPKSRRFLLRLFWSWISGEFYVPDLLVRYPATFHINLCPEARRQGVGSGLMQIYLEHLKSHHVGGVLCSTASAAAKEFFERQGFRECFSRDRSYWASNLGSKFRVHVMGRQIAWQRTA